MEIIIGITVGILSSLIASVLFLLGFSRLRPKILISPKIAVTEINSRIVYQIKIKNISRNRQITNIRAELHLISNRAAPRGRLSEATSVPLTRSDPIIIDSYNPTDDDAMYAARFRTEENLESVWDDNTQYLRFIVYGSDSLSGLGKTFEQKYTLKRTDLVKGDFCVGDSCDIE